MRKRQRKKAYQQWMAKNQKPYDEFTAVMNSVILKMCIGADLHPKHCFMMQLARPRTTQWASRIKVWPTKEQAAESVRGTVEPMLPNMKTWVEK